MRDLADRRGFDLDVYGPAEDSSLLAEAACSHLDDPDLVVDVGTGTGYVANRIRQVCGATVIGTDANPHACRRARENGVPVIRCDLVEAVRGGCADAVTFNPPYLPTDPDESGSNWLTVAIEGGETGREVIERFLETVGRVLTPDGVGFLLVSTYTGVDAVTETAAANGFHAVAVADASFPGETLTVLKLVR